MAPTAFPQRLQRLGLYEKGRIIIISAGAWRIFRSGRTTFPVTPAQAGVQNHRLTWIPAFAGMTTKEWAIPCERELPYPRPRYGATPWSGSHRPAGGVPVCQKTSMGMPPRGYQ